MDEREIESFKENQTPIQRNRFESESSKSIKKNVKDTQLQLY